MNDTLLGSTIQDIGRDIQKLSRDIRKLEGYLNTIGSPSDTEEYRMNIRNEVHRTTALVKQLLSSIQDMKSQDSNSIKLQRMEQQFLEQYRKLKSITTSIKNRLDATSPQRVEPGSFHKKGGYDLSNVQMDDQNLIQYENHPSIPAEEMESTSTRQSQSFVPQFDSHLEELEQREEAIHKMADDLQELHEMHQDLHHLVNEQGVCHSVILCIDTFPCGSVGSLRIF